MGVLNIAKSPRVDSHRAQTIGPVPKSTSQGPSSSISMLTGSTTHLAQPQRSTQQGHDGNMSNIQNPFIINQWRNCPPHTPLAPAFASWCPQTPTTQTANTPHVYQVLVGSGPILCMANTRPFL
jgi:hypothetical protein